MPETNFLPNPNWNQFQYPALTCVFGNCYGHGVPSNNVGFDGNTYVDLDTLVLYVKANGVWGVSSGGGGITIVSSAPVADPGTDPEFAYNPATGEVWLWSGTAWDKILG